MSAFIVPKLRESVTDILDSALNGKETSNYELEIMTKSNEFRYLLVNATTRRNAENNIIGVVGVAQDVTEAIQRDRAVAVLANELRQLVVSTSRSFYIIVNTIVRILTILSFQNRTQPMPQFSALT